MAVTLVQPTGEMWKQIRVELNEDINTRERDLATIKDWLRKQPHLPDEWALDKDIDTHMLNDAFKIAMMIGDIRLKEEIEGVAGDVYVLDASSVSASHLGKVSPAAIKKFMICVQEAYPVKLKEVHVINASPIVDAAYNIVKPFLKEKIKNRTFFHADISELQKYIPKEIIPVEYGGNGCSLEEVNKAWAKKLEEYIPWFKEQEDIKANEALRPGKPTNYDELFGIDGSFRQLSID